MQELENIGVLGEQRIVEAPRDVSDLRDVEYQQEHVRHVDLPGAPEDIGGCHHEAALAHQGPVDEPGRVAEYENDDFRGVAEAVAANGESAHHRRGQLVQEQQPERKPAEEIEPQIALDRNDGAHQSDLSSAGRRVGKGPAILRPR